jgi:hypothetical protein
MNIIQTQILEECSREPSTLDQLSSILGVSWGTAKDQARALLLVGYLWSSDSVWGLTSAGDEALRESLPREEEWGAVAVRLKRQGWHTHKYGGLFIGYSPKLSRRIESRTVAGLLRRAREVGTP